MGDHEISTQPFDLRAHVHIAKMACKEPFELSRRARDVLKAQQSDR
jgi:hypothetical protein